MQTDPESNELTLRLERLQQFRSMDPSNAGLAADIAVLLSQLQRHDEAQACLDSVVDPQGKQHQLQYAQALVYLGSGKAPAARDMFAALLGDGVTSDEVRYGYAYACILTREYERASAVLAEEPEQPWDGWFMLRAKALHHLGDLPGAVASLENLPVPDSPEVDGLRALLYHDMGDATAARECAEVALQAMPDCADARLVKAALVLAEGEVDSARETFMDLVEAWPDRGRPYLGLGLADMMSGQFADAKAALQQGIARIQGEMQGRMALAWCDLIAGSVQDAAKVVSDAQSLAPDSRELQGMSAVMEVLKGDIAGAQKRITAWSEEDRKFFSCQVAQLLLQQVLEGKASSGQLLSAFQTIATRPDIMKAVVSNVMRSSAAQQDQTT